MAEQFLADPKLVSQGFNKEQFLDLWRIEANDVVLCMDADTGKTFGKVLPGRTLPRRLGKPRNANNTPAAGAGKIFFYSSMSVLRALNAESGELVWEAWNSEEKQAQRQAVIERGHLQEKRAPKAIMGPPVLFADGLAIFTHAVSKNNYGRENPSSHSMEPAVNKNGELMRSVRYRGTVSLVPRWSQLYRRCIPVGECYLCAGGRWQGDVETDWQGLQRPFDHRGRRLHGY